jgi:hypothetical protein
VFKGVLSGDKTIIRNAAYCAAKTAVMLKVPVVLSVINPKNKGPFMEKATKLFGQEAFARKVPGIDAFEDEATFNDVEVQWRKKIVTSLFFRVQR